GTPDGVPASGASGPNEPSSEPILDTYRSDRTATVQDLPPTSPSTAVIMKLAAVKEIETAVNFMINRVE
ncbi:hypothetical protein ACSNN7_29115, partial [Micromonospora sp. URMC 105]|uniref:hypothetical protein n=1 Tax=Micromonospora sp. URMC 105 TaxID=3423413 RepID=UPI003F1B7729